MGYSGANFEDIFSDKIEQLPGEILIEQQEIQRALSGECFKVIESSGDEWLPSISANDFLQCLQLWDDYHYLGLIPSQKRSVLEVIKIGEKARRDVESWRASHPVEASIRK